MIENFPPLLFQREESAANGRDRANAKMAKNFFMDSQFLGSTAKSKPPKCLDSRCLQGPDKPIGKRKRAEHRCPAL